MIWGEGGVTSCNMRKSVLFVHDGINSVADYNSLRVGVGWMSDVGCMYVCMLDVPVQISRLDNF